MKPLTNNWDDGKQCTQCGAVLDNEYECSYCGTVYRERPEPEFKITVENVSMTLAEGLGLLMFFPFSLFLIKPKKKITKVCINEKELKHPLPVKAEETKKKNSGCATLLIFIILLWLAYKYFTK